MKLFRAPLSLGDIQRNAFPAGALIECIDADTVVALSSRVHLPEAPVGVWLEVSSSYSAQMIARDIATLSHLITLDHVAIAAPANSFEHTEIVRALLTDGPVSISNVAGDVVDAFNRPLPPNEITIWEVTPNELRSANQKLAIQSDGVSYSG